MQLIFGPPERTKSVGGDLQIGETRGGAQSERGALYHSYFCISKQERCDQIDVGLLQIQLMCVASAVSPYL